MPQVQISAVKIGRAIALGPLLLLSTGFNFGQEHESAQKPAEEQVASDFEAAAPALFAAWLENRPQVLKAVGLGRQGTTLPGCAWPTFFYTFIQCDDVVTPTAYSIDVKRTDSLLTPFVGIITVPITENCMARHVVPVKSNWSRKNFDKFAPYCLGKTYDDCIAAGAKDAPGLVGSACTGGPVSTFPYSGNEVLTYRWSHKKWEFQGEDAVPPRTVPSDK